MTIALLLGGTALGSGSFSAKIDVTALEVDMNLEQSVAEWNGWTIYAGSGFAVSREGVERLAPYSMACKGWDAFIAYAEVCTELRAPIIGPGSILRVYFSAVW